MEYCIGIDINEIVEIFGVLTCHHITRSIGVGKGIQKGLQRPLKELYEGIFGFVLSTPTENGMFQYVRHTGRIGGGSTEGNTEAFVIVVRADGEEFGATLFVSIESAVGAKFIDNVGGDNVEGGVGDAQVLLEFGGYGGSARDAAGCTCGGESACSSGGDGMLRRGDALVEEGGRG